MATNISTAGFAGVNLRGTDGTTAQFGLGTGIESANGDWSYIQANGAITAGDLVAISITGTGTRATPALAATGQQLAFAQYSFLDTEYGWVVTGGGNPLTVNVSATSTLQAVLYVAATSGKLSTTASSGTLAGISLQTASTTAVVAAFTAIVTWPRDVGPGN